MWGLAMNIGTFSHLLKKVDFDAVVDHLAIRHIMRSKAAPATTRIKRLPMHSIWLNNLAQPLDKGLPTHPIPMPMIGQGRPGLRRKIRTN